MGARAGAHRGEGPRAIAVNILPEASAHPPGVDRPMRGERMQDGVSGPAAVL